MRRKEGVAEVGGRSLRQERDLELFRAARNRSKLGRAHRGFPSRNKAAGKKSGRLRKKCAGKPEDETQMGCYHSLGTNAKPSDLVMGWSRGVVFRLDGLLC